MGRERIDVENVRHPGRLRFVDAAKYDAMKRAYLAVLPESSPGPTLEEIRARLPARLPADLYPGGEKAGWWAKTVQLDLEAKGVIVREPIRPLRLHKAR